MKIKAKKIDKILKSPTLKKERIKYILYPQQKYTTVIGGLFFLSYILISLQSPI